jgi:DNA-directed RNA polymerase alpha subunit
MAESASVDILPLSIRTRNCLHSVNITTVGELFCLAALPENGHGFRWVRNFGAKCLHEIRQAVSQYSPRMAIELNVVLERRSKGEMTGGCDSAVNPSEGG